MSDWPWSRWATFAENGARVWALNPLLPGPHSKRWRKRRQVAWLSLVLPQLPVSGASQTSCLLGRPRRSTGQNRNTHTPSGMPPSISQGLAHSSTPFVLSWGRPAAALQGLEGGTSRQVGGALGHMSELPLQCADTVQEEGSWPGQTLPPFWGDSPCAACLCHLLLDLLLCKLRF